MNTMRSFGTGRAPLSRRVAALGVVVALAATACSGESRNEADAETAATTAAAASTAASAAGSAAAAAAPAAGGDIAIGGSFPFSGPFAIFANASNGAKAYFESVNAAGGVNGRKIVYTTNDDGYDPGRLAANARKSVEQDKVAAFLAFGGPNVAIQPYLNENKVPHIVLAGNAEFSNPKFPYTHAFWPDLTYEASFVTNYVMDNPKDFPDPKIGLISLNNTLAASHTEGTVKSLGDKAESIFPKANRLQVEPTVNDFTSQVNQLRAAGVNVLYLSAGAAGLINVPKYVKQIGWNDVKIFAYSGTSTIKGAMQPAGPASAGIYTPVWLKDPADARWANDTGVTKYEEVIAKYGSGADPANAITANGYAVAEALVSALKGAGDGELTGDAINNGWLAVKDQPSDLLMPGSTLDAGPGGRLVFRYQMTKFDGKSYQDVTPLADVRSLGIAK